MIGNLPKVTQLVIMWNLILAILAPKAIPFPTSLYHPVQGAVASFFLTWSPAAEPVSVAALQNAAPPRLKTTCLPDLDVSCASYP